jgi:hypothetical protein
MYIYDPRFQIFDNTAESPLPDGGGDVIADLHSGDYGQYGPKCSNVQRTFLNEEGCFMSSSPNACTSTASAADGDAIPEAFVTLSHETIRTIYQETGGGAPGTMYLYAVDHGLNIERDPDVQSPCIPGVVSRWAPVACSETSSSSTVGAATANLMSRLINRADRNNGDNPYFVDVHFPVQLDVSCNDDDVDLVGFEVPDLNDVGDTLCWRNVHPDHLDVYDFTQWTLEHPGNSDLRNPIKEFAEAGQSRLLFPDWHELSRWNSFKATSRVSIPLGGQLNYYRLPAKYQTDSLALALGVVETVTTTPSVPSNIGGAGTLVCGSPNEVANDPELGGADGRGAFTTPVSSTHEYHFVKQRGIAWTIAALTDPGQLRQRIAWALSQILVVSPAPFRFIEQRSYTEAFLVYYDIFVSMGTV